MSIPRETIEIIRDRAHIEDIVRKYVPSLQKKGKNFVGLCPFHKEKTPSFTVSPDKQIFYCFGCHAGGNVYTFISKIERLNFPESVRFLGGLVGVSVRDDADTANPREAAESDVMKKLNRLAAAHYHAAIKSDQGGEGREYILERGITSAAIDEFKLGYAPGEWDFLTSYLKSRRAPMNLALKLGLVSSSDKNGRTVVYDRFRKRIVFPIFNQKNEIIGFGGRIIGNGDPKYLNSPESELFSKGSILYGFNIAREHIADLKRAIVVEGYLDVIGCHQAGIKNVVAPLGTALTTQQVRLLSRYCNEIVLLFDADSAGIKASLRSLEIMKDVNVEARVAILPEGDPFDYIRKKGMREFMAIVDSSMNPVDFKIERVIAGANGKNGIDVLRGVFAVIRDIEFDTERSMYLKKASVLLSMDENDVRRDFKRFLDGRSNLKSHRARAVKPEGDAARLDFQARSYRDLIALVCHYPELVRNAMIDFSEADITDSVSRSIFVKIGELYSAGEAISIDRLFNFFTDGEEKAFLDWMLFRESKIESPAAAYTEIYINLKLYLIDQKINYFIERVKLADSSDGGDSREYLTEIEILRREREKLSAYMYNKKII